MTDSPTVTLADGIATVLSEARGETVTVTNVRRLTGGASRQVWSVDARTCDGTVLPVVLRRDPPGHGDAVRMRAEAACLRTAAAAGVPVPPGPRLGRHGTGDRRPVSADEPHQRRIAPPHTAA